MTSASFGIGQTYDSGGSFPPGVAAGELPRAVWGAADTAGGRTSHHTAHAIPHRYAALEWALGRPFDLIALLHYKPGIHFNSFI
jgi:hypothetical protein